jgi:tRNA(Ile)-lysidine synthase
MDKVILRRLLRRAIDKTQGLRGIEFVHIEDIIGLIKLGKSGDRLYLPKGMRVIKGYSTLLLTSKPPLKLVSMTFDVPCEVKLKEAGITLKAEILEKIDREYDGKTSAVFDFDRLILPLKVRARKRGDYFYPSGFGKRKKLQDFFVDSKIPRDERDSIPILISGEDVIWVVGYRMDERFRAKEVTKKFLVVSL